MDSAGDAKLMRELVQCLDDAERALAKFEDDIPVRRDILIRNVDSAKDAISHAMDRKPTTDARQPALITSLKALRCQLPDGQPVTFTDPPSRPMQPAAPAITRCRAGCHSAVHSLSACPKFAKFNLQLRTQLVRADGLCYRCLEAGHGGNNCPRWELRCGHVTGFGSPCQRAHHILLHGVVLDEIFRR